MALSASRQTISSPTAVHIRELAQRHHVAYRPRLSDGLANDITRLAGDVVQLDEVELLLLGLQRAGHIARNEMVLLQAKYLSEKWP